jgi:hypothetical protein
MGGSETMNQIAILESLIEVLKKQIAIIEQQADALKCCGNCVKYTASRRCYNMRPGSYCHDWYPDELTRGDRQ